jgi:uncharacterized protein
MVLRYAELNPTGKIEYDVELNKYLAKTIDVLAFNEVKACIDYKKNGQVLELVMKVNCNLDLMCDVTGLKVETKFDFIVELLFGSTLECDYPITSEIDLDELVFAYVISEKPFVVYHPSVKIEEI